MGESAYAFEQQSLQGSSPVTGGHNEQPGEQDRRGLPPVDRVGGFGKPPAKARMSEVEVGEDEIAAGGIGN